METFANNPTLRMRIVRFYSRIAAVVLEIAAAVGICVKQTVDLIL
jgi:hypothetical protein